MSRRQDLALATVAVMASSSPGCTRAQNEYAAGCQAGQKACAVAGSLRCVAVDDPAFGCAPATCDPCVVDNATAACQAGACAVGACSDGYEDCDSLRDNGCEAHLDTDPEHCGDCESPCELERVATASCAGGKCGIAACDDSWLDCNGDPADGCELESRTGYCNPELILQSTVGLTGVAVDDDYVYFAANGQLQEPKVASSIRRVDKHATHPNAVDEELAPAAAPYGVAVDGGDVLFSDFDVLRMPKTGGAPASIGPAPFATPFGVAVVPGPRGSAVYWTNFAPVEDVAGVWKLEGGSAYGVKVCSDGCASYAGVAVSQGELFWAVFAALPLGGVFSQSLTGGSGPGFNEAEDSPVFCAVDEHHVYWTTDEELRFRGRAPDAPPSEVLANVEGYGGVALDETFVYFSELTGKSLRRLRKPLPP